MDEPTIGLDVVVKERIREFIKEINRTRGITVILATHDMSDIERLCRRVMIINHGQIIYDGGLNSLMRKYGTRETIVADIQSDIDDIRGLYELGVNEVNRGDKVLTIKYDNNTVKSSVVLEWLMNRSSIKDLNIAETQIEDVIRRIYELGI